MDTTKIVINGKIFEHVKNRHHAPVSIYKAADVYLRIGPKDKIQKEIDVLKKLEAFGFPVPHFLEEGNFENRYYYTETSIGDEHFSQIFKKNLSLSAVVSNADIGKLIEFTKKYAEAQLKTINPVNKFVPSQFEDFIHLSTLLTELPQLETKTVKAIQKVEKVMVQLPQALTHGDYNPHNIYPGGIIDWESSAIMPLGYDIATNIIQIYFFPLKGDYEFIGGYTYSKEQIGWYWDEIDKVYVEHGLPKISNFKNDFIFSRCIWSVVRMQKTPKIQKWRYDQYEKVLDAYLNDEDLSEFLRTYFAIL